MAIVKDTYRDRDYLRPNFRVDPQQDGLRDYEIGVDMASGLDLSRSTDDEENRRLSALVDRVKLAPVDYLSRAKEPVVESERCFTGHEAVYRMRVSDEWLVDTRFARLRLSWRMLRAIWK